MIQLTCTFSIDNHWRYGSLIYIMTLIIDVRVQYFTTVLHCLHSGDSAVVHYVHFYRTRDTTVLYFIYRLPFEILQSFLYYVIDDSNQDAIPNWSYNPIRYNVECIGCVVSSCLMQENVCARIFKIQVWRAASAHKYGPMELLRPAYCIASVKIMFHWGWGSSNVGFCITGGFIFLISLLEITFYGIILVVVIINKLLY